MDATRDFNIRMDSSDQSTKLQNAIDSVFGYFGGGAIAFRAGTLGLDAGITLPSNIELVGSRRGTGIFRRSSAATFTMIDLSGATSGTYSRCQSIRDITLNGNGSSGLIVKGYYVSEVFFSGVRIQNATGTAIDFVQLWDSRFDNTRFDSIASAGGLGFRIRNSVAASGFGSSALNSNNVYFNGCVFESFVGTPLAVERGGFGSDFPSAIFLVNCKFESGVATLPFVTTDQYTTHLQMMNCTMRFGGSTPPASPIPAVIVDDGGPSIISGVHFSVGGNAWVDAMVSVSGGSVHHYVDMLQVGGQLSNGMVAVTGGSPTVVASGCQHIGNPTLPMFTTSGGATPRFVGAGIAFVSGSGKTSVSDSDWPAGVSLVPNGSQILVKNTADSSYRLFVRTEGSTWKGVELTL